MPLPIPSEITEHFVTYLRDNGYSVDKRFTLHGAKRVAFLKDLQKVADNIGFDLPTEVKSGNVVIKDAFVGHQMLIAKAQLGKENSRTKEYLKELNERHNTEKKAKQKKIQSNFVNEASKKDTGVFTDEEALAKLREIINLKRVELGNRSIQEMVENVEETQLSAYFGSTMSNLDIEAYNFLCYSDRDPIVLHLDGRTIGKKEAKKDFGFEHIILHEDMHGENVTKLEKLLHERYYSKLSVADGHRLYTHCGLGRKYVDVKGHGILYFTFSTSLVPAITERILKINLGRLRGKELDEALQKRDALRDAARDAARDTARDEEIEKLKQQLALLQAMNEALQKRDALRDAARDAARDTACDEEIEKLKQQLALFQAMNQDSKPAALSSPPREPSPEERKASSPRKQSAKKQKLITFLSSPRKPLQAMNQDSKPAALSSSPRKPSPRKPSPKKQKASSQRKQSAKKQKRSSTDPKSDKLKSLSKVDRKGMRNMESFFQKK